MQILALVKCELRVVQSSLVGSILSHLRELLISLLAVHSPGLPVVADLELPLPISSVGKPFFLVSLVQ